MRPKKRDLHELPFTENVKSEAFRLASEMAVETAFYIFFNSFVPRIPYTPSRDFNTLCRIFGRMPEFICTDFYNFYFYFNFFILKLARLYWKMDSGRVFNSSFFLELI